MIKESYHGQLNFITPYLDKGFAIVNLPASDNKNTVYSTRLSQEVKSVVYASGTGEKLFFGHALETRQFDRQSAIVFDRQHTSPFFIFARSFPSQFHLEKMTR